MKLTAEELSLSAQCIHIAGRLDAAHTPEVKEFLQNLTRDGKCNFIVDLRKADFIDSTGLGLLTSLVRAARGCGGDVCLVITQLSPVFTMLTIVRFDSVFMLYETPESALAHFLHL